MKDQLRTAVLVKSLLLSGCISVSTTHTPSEGSAKRERNLPVKSQAFAAPNR